MSLDRAQKIKVILFDVDGVLTDGGIWLFPTANSNARIGEAQAHADVSIQSQNMIEAKGFNAQDGAGFGLARLGGLKAGVVTKRVSEAVALPARDLKLDYVFQGAERNLRCWTKS